MSASRSKLPKATTTAYWAEVRQLLTTQHHLRPTAAVQAVRTYRAVLAEDGVGDEIYHSPVDETAKGIVEGGYAAGEPSPTAKRSSLSKQ